MKNFVQRGNTITVPAPHDVTGGEPIIIGDLKGIVAGDALTGGDCDIVVAGVFDLPKPGAEAFIVGAPTYYDDALKLVTTNATKPKLGVCVRAAGADDYTVRVLLGAVAADI